MKERSTSTPASIDTCKDVGRRFPGARFEPKVPTGFKCLRRHFPDAPEHHALILNGEGRIDEEF